MLALCTARFSHVGRRTGQHCSMPLATQRRSSSRGWKRVKAFKGHQQVRNGVEQVDKLSIRDFASNVVRCQRLEVMPRPFREDSTLSTEIWRQRKRVNGKGTRKVQWSYSDKVVGNDFTAILRLEESYIHNDPPSTFQKIPSIFQMIKNLQEGHSILLRIVKDSAAGSELGHVPHSIDIVVGGNTRSIVPSSVQIAL